MGLFKIIKNEKFQIGIWEITETVDELEEFTVDFTYSHWERVV